ncbi:MAG: rod shape-determining protein MreD [Candidatus Moranbacteria bacterium]|nr:rod shape-determining protein MreD [Candidatus Moranbacteria bacterium]
MFLFIFCFAAAVLQISAGGVFFPQSQIPDLALGLVIALVLALGFSESVKWIFLVGILIDSASSSVFGSATLSYFLVAWAVSQIAEVADIRSQKTFFLSVLAAAVAASEILKDAFLVAVLKLRSGIIHIHLAPPIHFFSLDYALKIAYTVVAAFILYYLLRKLSRRFFLEPVRLAKKF